MEDERVKKGRKRKGRDGGGAVTTLQAVLSAHTHAGTRSYTCSHSRSTATAEGRTEGEWSEGALTSLRSQAVSSAV